MFKNNEDAKDFQDFMDWCEKNNLRASNRHVLREYMKRREENLSYKLNLNKLKGSMAEHGVTQKDVAIYLGMSEMQISRKFSQKADFKVNELLAISELLKEQPELFFTLNVDTLSTTNRNN